MRCLDITFMERERELAANIQTTSCGTYDM
jgi:hypothetical protein